MNIIIPYPYSLWLIIGGITTTAFLAVAWLLLANLSRGTARRLEDINPDLAEKMETWLDSRDDLRVGIRLLHIVTTVATLWGALSLPHAANASNAGIAAMALIWIIAYFLVTELIGCDLNKGMSWILLKAFMPVVISLNALTIPLLWPLQAWRRRASKKRRDENDGEADRTTTEDEIMSLVEQDEADDQEDIGLDSDERRMIKSIFDLDETLVREIMTPRIYLHAATDDSTVEEIRKLIVESGHSRIPVYEKSIDHIIGVIHAKDLLKHTGVNISLRELIRQTVFIPETKNVAELLTEFRQNNTQFAIVIDEYGGTEGVVTLEDILEEIVGEIHDEYDSVETEAVIPCAMPDGSFMVEGRTPIYELNEKYDFDLPEDKDFDTFGGYLAAEIGRIPEPGENIVTKLLDIEVLEADRRKVIRARITTAGKNANGNRDKGEIE